LDTHQAPISKETTIDDYPIEVKYIEAAIQALASGKDEEEADRVKNFGNAILNVAIKTKKKCEATKKEGGSNGQ
jgi:hypothetical protein